MKIEALRSLARVIIVLLWFVFGALSSYGTWALLSPDWTITRVFVVFVCVAELFFLWLVAIGLWILTVVLLDLFVFPERRSKGKSPV